MSISDTLVHRLISEYQFKKVGEWLREGRCPECGKKELYTHANNPRVVKCGRLNKCGFESHVKELYADIFTEWSKQHAPTPQNPTATADAYLSQARGLSLGKIKGAYTQDNYYDPRLKLGTPTVRFAMPNGGFWERLIENETKLGKKANLKQGVSVKGYWWYHPANKSHKFPKEIWITEGIFDACALAEHGLITASSISCTNFPEQSLSELKREYGNARQTLPVLVWAYDCDKAGQDNTKKAIEQATKMGFESVAAQPPYDKHKKLDWNDLHELHRLYPDDLKKYRYFGDLLTAKTASDAGVIRFLHTRLNQFYFEHNNRTYWFELDSKRFSQLTWAEDISTEIQATLDSNKPNDITDLFNAVAQTSTTQEILNAKLEALYFQRNEITDESWYFMRVMTPKGEKQTTITGEQLSSPSKLKPRLLSVFAGVLWTGNAMQLDILAKHQMEGLKEVKTTDFIGYSREHGAYIFNDVAIKDGKVVDKNQYDYFKIGRLEVKSLANDPELHINHTDMPDFGWWQDFHHVRGDYGTIVLAWWLGSYFAEQIRKLDRSYPFFELVGQAGAGKSRLLEFCWKLSGRADYEGFDPTKSTSVAVFRNFAQVSNLPICLIEGDRNDETAGKFKTFVWDSLKDAFNGRSIRSKGVKNSGNDTYSPPFRAAIMISQNEEIQASEAMLTRIVHVKLTRDGQTLATKRIVDALDRMELDVASRFIAHALKNEHAIMQTYAEKVAMYEHMFHEQGITHTRIALNHAQLCALVDCLQRHMFGRQMSEAQAMSAKKTLFDMAGQRIERLSADHADVEKFWGVFEYLYNCKIYTNHKRIDEGVIAINLNHFYKIAKLNYQDLPEINTMKKLLKTSSKYKFLDSNITVRSVLSDYDMIKCWLFKNPYVPNPTS